jgi:hypothetical protein
MIGEGDDGEGDDDEEDQLAGLTGKDLIRAQRKINKKAVKADNKAKRAVKVKKKVFVHAFSC